MILESIDCFIIPVSFFRSWNEWVRKRMKAFGGRRIRSGFWVRVVGADLSKSCGADGAVAAVHVSTFACTS